MVSFNSFFKFSRGGRAKIWRTHWNWPFPCPGPLISPLPICRIYIQKHSLVQNMDLYNIWPLDIFMSLKLIIFQNDLRFWPFWGPEISFFIIFLTIFIFRKNIFQKIFFCVFIFYLLVYLRINNPENWPKIA